MNKDIPYRASSINFEKPEAESSSNKVISIITAFIMTMGLISFCVFQNNIAQELFFLLLTIPIILIIRTGNVQFSLAFKIFITCQLYLSPVLFSFLFHVFYSNRNLFNDIVLITNLYYSFIVAAIFASSHDDELWMDIMRYTATFSIPFFIYVAATQQHAYVYGRWEPYELQPNWWGMMSLGLAWCSFMYSNLLLRIGGLTVSLYFMLAVQSRGSIVAFLPALFFSSGFFIPFSKKKLIILSMMLFGFIIILIYSTFLNQNSVGSKMYEFFMIELMKINDPYRGIGTGLTGRIYGYSVAWKEFLKSPLFGQGFGEFGFVHSGFLLTIAESGIFALVGMIIIFGRSLYGFFKVREWTGFGYSVSYITILLTFPRTFNINMTSLIFLIIMMKGLGLPHLHMRIESR